MENKINVAKLLKNCPKGMELDCMLWDNVTFERVAHNGIWINYLNDKNYKYEIYLDNEGCLPVASLNLTTSKCVIYPKGKNTWEGFVPPCKFKDGDVVSIVINKNLWHGIYQKESNTILYCYVSYSDSTQNLYSLNKNGICQIDNIVEMRLASEEEKQKLFDVIKANGYKWNAKNKTLEKLIVPMFKINNIIRHKERKSNTRIVDIKDGNYIFENGDIMPIYLQNDYEFMSDKFDIDTLKPFDKVLVRDGNDEVWVNAFFGFCDPVTYKTCIFVTGNENWCQCIPYEGNEHLLGTTNDCDDYFKTWQK